MTRIKTFKSFIIVGTQRTGSSALAEQVGLHPRVSCGWEWTERVAWPAKIRVMSRALQGDFSTLPKEERQHMVEVYSSETDWIGFRRLFGASDKWVLHPRYSVKLLWDRFSDHLKWFRTHRDVSIVHIVRADDVAWVKSKYLAAAARTYVGKPYPEDLRITIPIREAVARVRSKHWIDDELARLAQTNPYLEIRYEDMVRNMHDTARRALEFLGCAAVPSNTSRPVIERQSTRSDREYILNYDELLAALRTGGA